MPLPVWSACRYGTHHSHTASDGYALAGQRGPPSVQPCIHHTLSLLLAFFTFFLLLRYCTLLPFLVPHQTLTLGPSGSYHGRDCLLPLSSGLVSSRPSLPHAPRQGDNTGLAVLVLPAFSFFRSRRHRWGPFAPSIHPSIVGRTVVSVDAELSFPPSPSPGRGPAGGA